VKSARTIVDVGIAKDIGRGRDRGCESMRRIDINVDCVRGRACEGNVALAQHDLGLLAAALAFAPGQRRAPAHSVTPGDGANDVAATTTDARHGPNGDDAMTINQQRLVRAECQHTLEGDAVPHASAVAERGAERGHEGAM